MQKDAEGIGAGPLVSGDQRHYPLPAASPARRVGADRGVVASKIERAAPAGPIVGAEPARETRPVGRAERVQNAMRERQRSTGLPDVVEERRDEQSRVAVAVVTQAPTQIDAVPLVRQALPQKQIALGRSQVSLDQREIVSPPRRP